MHAAQALACQAQTKGMIMDDRSGALRHWLRSTLAATTVLLAACGGGASTPAPPTLTLLPPASSFRVTADTSAPGVAPVSVVVRVKHLETLSSPSGVIYNDAQANWLGASGTSSSMIAGLLAGTTELDGDWMVSLNLLRPGVLGAGTYGGNLVLRLCYDQACNSVVPQSTLTLAVTYTVTGTAGSDVRATIQPNVPVEVASNVAAPTYDALYTLSDVIPTPVVSYAQPASGFITSTTLQATGYNNGSIRLGFRSPSAMGLGVFQETMQVSVCLDAACTRPLMGSPYAVNISYTVTAGAGNEYTVRVLPFYAMDLGTDPAHRKVYAAGRDLTGLQQTAFAEIDPASGTVTRTVPVAGTPLALAISDDGAYAYVGYTDSSLVQRFRLADMVNDATIDLGSTPANGPLHAWAIAAMPGQATSVAIQRYGMSPGDFAQGQVALYDGTVLRGAPFGDTSIGQVAGALAWLGDGSTLASYSPAQSTLYRVAVGAGGLSQAAALAGAPYSPRMQYLGGYLYTAFGAKVDPATGATVANFQPQTGQGTIALDAGVDRAWRFYTDNSRGPTLAAYQLSSLAPLGVARLQSLNPSASILNSSPVSVRWGPRGLAFNTTNGLALLEGTFVAP
jgi:hypothetical protein